MAKFLGTYKTKNNKIIKLDANGKSYKAKKINKLTLKVLRLIELA